MKRDCEGSGYYLGTVDRKAPGYRAACPICNRIYMVTHKVLGPRGSCSGYAAEIPKHKERGGYQYD